MSIWYNHEKHGSLEKYISSCKTEQIPICFKGYEQFLQLQKEGYLVPYLTTIRLMHNHAREDENYIVNDDFQLEGIISKTHSGREGTNDPKDILKGDAPYFEADMLKPKSSRN